MMSIKKILNTSDLVKKTILMNKFKKLKIPDTSGLVNKTNFNSKVTETKNRIPYTTS